MPRKSRYSKPSPPPPQSPKVLTVNDVADAYGLLDESRTLLRVLNDLSRGGEVKATFQDIQNKCGLDGLRMCWSFKDLHEFGIITLQSGWRPETPVFFKIGKTTDLKARMTENAGVIIGHRAAKHF